MVSRIVNIFQSKLFQYFCWANIVFFAFVAYQNYTNPASMALSPYIEKKVYHAGDVVTVNYNVIRFKSCTLHINRILISDVSTEDDPGREYLIATEDREVNGTNTLIPSTYSAKIPETMKPGTYQLTSRVRYYCNPLDYILPHMETTQTIQIEIQ
jgi:hypothetical protein